LTPSADIVYAPTGTADDDGSGEELTVPLGTTAFVSGATMFDRLSPAEKSLVVRMKVRYVSRLSPYLLSPGLSDSCRR
jgi:hypothetical protein